MAQNDIFEVGFIIDVKGEWTACICHAQQTSTSPTEDEEQDLFDAVAASGISTTWAERSSDMAEWTDLKVQLISPTTRPPQYFAAGIPGSQPLEVLPAQSGCLHYWACPPFERRNIGRKNWSGLSIGAHNRGRLIDAQVTKERAFADNFEDVITSVGDYEFGVWSEKFESFEALGVVRPRVIVHNIRSRRGQKPI